MPDLCRLHRPPSVGERFQLALAGVVVPLAGLQAPVDVDELALRQVHAAG